MGAWRAVVARRDESVRDSLRRSLHARHDVKCPRAWTLPSPVDAQNAPTATWKTAQNAVSHSAHTHHRQRALHTKNLTLPDRTKTHKPRTQNPELRTKNPERRTQNNEHETRLRHTPCPDTRTMAAVKHHEDLVAWQLSEQLRQAVVAILAKPHRRQASHILRSDRTVCQVRTVEHRRRLLPLQATRVRPIHADRSRLPRRDTEPPPRCAQRQGDYRGRLRQTPGHSRDQRLRRQRSYTRHLRNCPNRD